MGLIEDLNWRYACKIMNGRVVEDDKINTILEAIRLAPTSIGMQLFKVLVIKDKNMIEQIYKTSASRQLMLPGCSHLLVFAAYTTFTDDMIEEYVVRMGKIRNYTDEHINQYRMKYKNWRKQFDSDAEILEWTTKQTYIAMAYATVAAAELRVDSTPVEGFEPDVLDELMGLRAMNLASTLLLPLGYRDEANDHLADAPKVRKNTEDLFIF